jgi:hypothetical protein
VAQKFAALDALVKRHEAAVPEVGADLAQPFIGERDVECIGSQEAPERAADLDRLKTEPVV